MKDLIAAGLLIQIFAPFLVTCIFTLLGFFLGRWWGRRQGYSAGWYDALFEHRNEISSREEDL